MMTEHSQALFDQAAEQLRQAQELLDDGRYGEAERLAYQASDSIAAGFMARLGGETEGATAEQTAMNENSTAASPIEAFERFMKSTRNIGSTPEDCLNIEHIIDTVAGLREAHDWSVLDEIAEADAELMLQHVEEMLGLVKG